MATDQSCASAGSQGPARRQHSERDSHVTPQPGRSPVLDAGQLDILGRYGSERAVADGAVLFAEGAATYDLTVVLQGAADVIAGYGQPGATVVASVGPEEFLGEMGLITGQRAYLSGTGLTLIGSRFDPGTRVLLEVMARNRLVRTWLDLEASPEAEQMLRSLGVPVGDLPIVLVPGGPVLRTPSGRALLDELGISGDASSYPSGTSDLLVVGAGPAGLAAAVNGASEGMATVPAEGTALGGQAGTSSRIENLLAFPAGFSGEEVAARAELQARTSSGSGSSWVPKRYPCPHRVACTRSGSNRVISNRSLSSTARSFSTSRCSSADPEKCR